MVPVRTKAEVIARLQGQRTQLRALGVAQLGLFGSFVRDEAGPTSDVDLLVDFEEGRKTYRAICALGDFVEELVGRPVEILGISHAEFEAGQLVREWVLIDDVAVWMQVLSVQA